MSWLQLCVVGLEVTKEDLILEQKQGTHGAIWGVPRRRIWGCC